MPLYQRHKHLISASYLFFVTPTEKKHRLGLGHCEYVFSLHAISLLVYAQACLQTNVTVLYVSFMKSAFYNAVMGHLHITGPAPNR